MIKTNWYVITGGPSCGKTTLVHYLALFGFAIFPETARLLIDIGRAKGKTTKEVRKNEAEFQKKIFEMKVKAEEKIPPERLTIFDRGIPDSIPFFELNGLDPAPVIEASKKRKYKKVFFLEQLPFERDYARTENEKLAKKISRLIYKAYIDLGYKPIIISSDKFEERVKIVLSQIK
jgi:predicted ATPase